MKPKAQESLEKSGWRENEGRGCWESLSSEHGGVWCCAHKLAVVVLTHQNPWAGSIEGKPFGMEEERAPEVTPLAEERVAIADCLNGVRAGLLQGYAR